MEKNKISFGVSEEMHKRIKVEVAQKGITIKALMLKITKEHLGLSDNVQKIKDTETQKPKVYNDNEVVM